MTNTTQATGYTHKDYFNFGRDFWYQYVKLNGYAWEPTEKGLDKLSKNLDTNKAFLRKCINVFLEA